MGVPKFFRWLSERYPKINQRAGYPPDEETCQRHFGKPPPPSIDTPDPLSTCGLPPPIDRLYIDMNGIIHGCSHNNATDEDDDTEGFNDITHEQIFANVCYYLDRIVGDIAEPTQLVYMAIDGVAPRAKLNQQRSRRYRSGNENEIEETVYEAHIHAVEERKRRQEKGLLDEEEDDPEQGYGAISSSASSGSSHPQETVQEVEPGRFIGKFETQQSSSAPGTSLGDPPPGFHSNSITPGTPFFTECTRHLEHFIRYKQTHDPKWQHLTIIFSGPNVPGEGEHKIMDFMRREKCREDYNPNLRHCIMGQDGDLVMLGLATHEPNLVLLREQVVFEMSRQKLLASSSEGMDGYIHNANFEWLHMHVLRDYLAYEFETSCVVPSHPYDLESTVDDFVFLTFFVGNDFLPHMPAIDIADEAFDLLFYSYKRMRNLWKKDKTLPPYLTHAGNIVSGHRLEQFLKVLGSHETPWFDNKKRDEKKTHERWRENDEKFGQEPTLPSDEVLELKEETDRAKFREMMESINPTEANTDSDAASNFNPVLSTETKGFQPTSGEDDLDEGMKARMGSLLQYSVSAKDGEASTLAAVDDQDLKGRYYWDKFGFTPFDAEKHIALRKAYMEGLVWNLKYYYEGCASWDWYYPYHYGPMLSDLVNLDEYLEEIHFEEKGEPLNCFEQLLGCLPPSSAYLLPKPYQWFLSDPSSPIIDFYPKTFTVDMNGKRAPWEAVVLLPFIDSKRLIDAARTLVTNDMLSPEEQQRRELGPAYVFRRVEGESEVVPAVGEGEHFGTINECKVPRKVLTDTEWHYIPETESAFKPEKPKGIIHPQPAFGSLQAVPIERLCRKRIGIDVFGLRSRYRTAILELSEALPALPSMEALAPKLIGTTVFFNYPYFMEGFVTAISSPEKTIRGTGENGATTYPPREVESRYKRLGRLLKQQQFGEKLTGTGGWMIPSSDVTLSVRPLKTLKTLKDGSKAKVYAKFEVEVPLLATVWSPIRKDPRIASLPSLLEKDPYFLEKQAVDSGDTGGAAAVTKGEGIQRQSIRMYNTAPKKGTSRGLATLARPDNLAQPTEVLQRYPSKAPLGSNLGRTGGFRGRLLVAGATALASVVFGANGAHATSAWTFPPIGPAALVESYSSVGLLARGGQQDMFQGANDLDKDHSPPPLEFAHGTTTISFIFNGGIIAAVDSRASIGNFVGSKTTQKVLPVNTHILGTMAGGAADCSFWIRKLKAQAQVFELTEQRRMSVARASRLLSNALYENRALDLSVGTMIMGFDPDKKGPSIYYVDNSGVRIQGDIFAVGSGSTFALGILDTVPQERRHDMTEEEAIALGIKAIRHATFRDAFSGGFIGVYLINKDGWKKVFSEDLARRAQTLENSDTVALPESK